MASTNIATAQSVAGRQPFSAWLRAAIEAERRQLALFVPVALGLGIALWFLLPFNSQRQAAALLALALAAGGFATTGTPRRVVVLAGLLVAAGLLLADLRSASVAAPRLYHRLTALPMTGTVQALTPQAGGARWRMELHRDANAIDPPVDVRLNLSEAPPPALTPGARVRVIATLGPWPGPAVPGGFDAARAGWFAGLSATGRVSGTPEILQPGQGAGRFSRWRQSLGTTIATRLGGDSGAIAAALVTGEQGRISAPTVAAMRTAGLAHILSVSGFHISIVVGGVFWLLQRLLALSPALVLRIPARWLAALGAGIAGTAYMFLAGANLPAVRATVAAWVVLAAMVLGRNPLSLRLIALAAFLIFVFRPEALLSPSFQLSFAAVLAIVVLARSPIGHALLAQPGDGWPLRGARVVGGLAATALVAELVLSPIALAHFGRAGAYGVLANIGAVPLTSLAIMPLLALWLALLPFGLDWLLGWAVRLAIGGLEAIAATVSAWPGASVTLPALPQTALMVLAGALLVLLLLEGPLRHLGWPLLALGAGLAIFAPRPNLFIDRNGQQLGYVQDGVLFTLRGHRGGYVVRNWAEKSDSDASARLADLHGARCNKLVCAVQLEGGVQLLAFLKPVPRSVSVAQICAAADIATAPEGLPADCQPRWLRLDPPKLVSMGAVAIDTRRRTLTSVGGRAGDHPWSPAAIPGLQPRLLGQPVWTNVVVE